MKKSFQTGIQINLKNNTWDYDYGPKTVIHHTVLELPDKNTPRTLGLEKMTPKSFKINVLA
jgi:hypothetical protein